MIKTLLTITALALTLASPAAADSAALDDLVAMLSGEFDTRRQMESDKRNAVPKDLRRGWVNRMFLPIDAPAVGSHVMVGSTRYGGPPWSFDKTEFLIWTFTVSADGNQIVGSPKRLKNLDAYIPFVTQPAKFAGIKPEDLEPAISAAACKIYWSRVETGFLGANDGCTVMSTTLKEMLTWSWRYRLDAHGMYIEFSGRDATGTIKTGTPDGIAYRLDRVSDAQALVASDPLMKDLMTLLTGTFDSKAQADEDTAAKVAKDEKHYRVNRTFHPVTASALGRPALLGTTSYHSAKDGHWTFDNLEFHIWTFDVSADGQSVTMTPRRFKDAEKRKPFAYDTSRFEAVTDADLEAAKSGSKCTLVWTRSDKGFTGRSQSPCKALHKPSGKMASWDWSYALTSDALFIAFSGKTASGDAAEQTPPGSPYRLDRVY